MSNDINLLSYSRACVYKRKPADRNLPFRGSSLSRSRTDRKKKEVVDEGQKTLHELLEEKRKMLYEDGSEEQIEGCIVEAQSTEQDNTLSKSRIFSRRTKRKVRDKAFAFMYTQRNTTVNFITLSFINKVTDKQGHQCLNKLLTVLRKHYGNFNYLWIAERQDGKRNKYCSATNNIHYHLLVDIRIPIVYANALWVVQQYNMGIVHPETDNEIGKTAIVDLFAKKAYKSIQQHLNPFDLKPVYNVQQASAYLTKYITKNEGCFESLIWHCSRGVSRLATAQTCGADIFDEANTSVNTYVCRNTKKVVKPKVVHHYDGNGFLIASTVPILNKQHFHRKHLLLLNEINLFFLSLDASKRPASLPSHFDILYNLN